MMEAYARDAVEIISTITDDNGLVTISGTSESSALVFLREEQRTGANGSVYSSKYKINLPAGALVSVGDTITPIELFGQAVDMIGVEVKEVFPSGGFSQSHTEVWA